MITVSVGLGLNGNLVSASVSGHAGKGKPGTDIVCAAVTILLRTTLAVLSGSGNSPVLEATTAGRGSLAFRVLAFTEADLPLLRYAAVFLREGISSLAGEYPEAVEMRVDQGTANA